MQVLNLVDKYDSTINYEIQKFPDGQQNVVIKIIILKSGLIGASVPASEHSVACMSISDGNRFSQVEESFNE